MKLKTGLTVAALAGAGALLAGCADEKALDAQWNSMDMGKAVHEDMTAQIADPDVAYKGPPGPSNGPRTELAQKHYETGAITPPPATTSMVQLQGGTGGNSGGGGPQ
jgi:hypothetical protein